MSRMIKWLEERIKEDFSNAKTPKEEKEANFKLNMLIIYDMYAKFALEDNEILTAQKAQELEHRQYMILRTMADMVYGYDKVLEAEYYEEHLEEFNGTSK